MENKFLSWLDSDPNLAKQRLEKIRHKLSSKFNSRWFLSNEEVDDCVQETLKRVLQNLENGRIAPNSVPETYTNGVANNVLKEKVDEKKLKAKRQGSAGGLDLVLDLNEHTVDLLIDEEDKQEKNRYLECLDKCIQELRDPNDRELIIMFLQNNCHYTQKMIERFGKTIEGLRSRIHRIKRHQLKTCVEVCVGNDSM